MSLHKPVTKNHSNAQIIPTVYEILMAIIHLIKYDRENCANVVQQSSLVLYIYIIYNYKVFTIDYAAYGHRETIIKEYKT